MNEYMISVIIPCFNGSRFIDRSIQSVFDQICEPIELIVVDDGSTDDSKEKILAWCNCFSDKGWCLKYVYQSNRGLGGAIDTGLKHVTGKYLALLDADDRFLPDSLDKKVRYLEEHPSVSLVRANGWIVNGENKWLFVQEDKEKELDDIFFALLLDCTNNWAGSYMVRTETLFSFYLDKCIYPSRFGQNLQIMLPVAYNRKCGFIDEPLMEYIRQENSLSATSDKERAFHKACSNEDGFFDIRIHMLAVCVQDNQQREHLDRLVTIKHWQNKMRIALEYHKKEAMVQAAQKLKTYKKLSLNDWICYYQLLNRPLWMILRIIRKMKKLLGR